MVETGKHAQWHQWSPSTYGVPRWPEGGNQKQRRRCCLTGQAQSVKVLGEQHAIPAHWSLWSWGDHCSRTILPCHTVPPPKRHASVLTVSRRDGTESKGIPSSLRSRWERELPRRPMRAPASYTFESSSSVTRHWGRRHWAPDQKPPQRDDEGCRRSLRRNVAMVPNQELAIEQQNWKGLLQARDTHHPLGREAKTQSAPTRCINWHTCYIFTNLAKPTRLLIQVSTASGRRIPQLWPTHGRKASDKLHGWN